MVKEWASYCQECYVPLQIKGQSAELKHINQCVLFVPKKNALEHSVTNFTNAFQQVQTERDTQKLVLILKILICLEGILS